MYTKVALGIDIGGTNIAYGLIDREGHCLLCDSRSTASYATPQSLVESLHRHIESDCQRLDLHLIGVGVGSPSGNYFNGTIENAANLSWKGIIPFAELLREEFRVPAFITNDAKASALGEMVYGGARGMKDFAVITLGTGVGSGIVVNGQLVYGHDGLAGELGHTIVRPGTRACNCGRRGCLETFVSATGIKRTACELLAVENAPSHLREIPYHDITAKKVFDAAQTGDPIALETFRLTGEILGIALANFVAVTSPEAIFLQGGVANAGEWIFKPTRESMEANLLHFYKNKVKLLPSSLSENAAIYGAASAVNFSETGEVQDLVYLTLQLEVMKAVFKSSDHNFMLDYIHGTEFSETSVLTTTGPADVSRETPKIVSKDEVNTGTQAEPAVVPMNG